MNTTVQRRSVKTALEAAKAVVNKPESQEQLDKAVEDLKAAQQA